MKAGGHNFHPSRISGIAKQRRERDINESAPKKPSGKIKPEDIFHFKKRKIKK